MDIKDAKKVVFSDYSNYKPETCRNGGDYAFYEVYERIGDNKWECHYETSADFEYCPVCGSFDNHYDDDNDCYCCGELEVISDDEMMKRIMNFEECDDMSLSVE